MPPILKKINSRFKVTRRENKLGKFVGFPKKTLKLSPVKVALRGCKINGKSLHEGRSESQISMVPSSF